ncbi:protein TRANSPARENT TESTA 9-like isoform X3 [Malania oleifera]|uniref:protein TRANSPARENT TESTA 9-like isoform X3 n=1 Tax=Malania oleifera TaxID=397392 RepID=UPI0025AECCCB|nr:protein TRANSPARENT TESTA 9-like isoform X3 [Malania oleifera]
MWRSLWRSIDRFSLQYFNFCKCRYMINELREIKVVDGHNRELVVDILQSIVEIVTYGDRHDPSIFECFMEYQVLADFVRVLKMSRDSSVEASLLQYLSIMIQNMCSEHAIYYCFSNDYINSIISHQFEFNEGDLAPYYVSFLRAVSSKINRDTICLLVKVHEDAVISFPLYSEALKFAHHGEKMIQTAVRALTLYIYNVSDDMVYQFLTTPPASQYFLDLVQSLRGKCFHLDAVVKTSKETCVHERRKELLLETDKIADDLYYLNDILCVGESRLSGLVIQNLLNSLVFPILLPLQQLSHSSGTNISSITSLYIVSRFLQVVDGKNMVNFVASVILDPYFMKDATEEDASDDICLPNSFSTNLDEKKEAGCSWLESEGAENINWNILHRHLPKCTSSYPHSDDTSGARSGLLSHLFSDNPGLLLASLILLVILAECKDLDSLLASVIGFSQRDIWMQKMMTTDLSASQVKSGIIFMTYMPQIVHALLKVLSRHQQFSVVLLHTGWFLRKLLAFQEWKLSDHDFHLFNTSYQQSCENLWKELDGCWFDYIPNTLRNEWESCKAVLEESPQSKDLFFLLELDFHEGVADGDMASSPAWEKMVDAVKLKAFIVKGNSPENSLTSLSISSMAISGITSAPDLSLANFGSELALGTETPCQIAFSKAGVKDVYLIPVASEISGKLLLVEKHPFHTRRGVVIAVAPLAVLNPTIDENHPTWLRLRIREFNPRFDASKTRSHLWDASKHVEDGTWTLGFPNAEACVAAQLLLQEAINKQRSFVKDFLAPLVQDVLPRN